MTLFGDEILHTQFFVLINKFFSPFLSRSALKVKELVAAAELPAVLRFSESDVQDPEVSSRVLDMRLFMLLEHLQNLFFIERLLSRFDRAGRGELLAVSYNMTSATLLYWTNMDGLGACEDFKWIVSGASNALGQWY